MQATSRTPWTPRLAAFAMALLLGASVVFWLMRWPSRETGRPLPLPTAQDDAPLVSSTLVAQLLGAGAPAAAQVVEASSRFRLTGVIASGQGQGVALVSIDGKPPKPYHVGSQLEDGVVLQSVDKRAVALAADAKSPASMHLELPAKQP
ncbi:MAG: general secretion pathway protein C [Rhodoferax sp.]|nr:general secretion pathway protein C [Rhodoferax sp.]